jgi:hypothetical protein
MRKRWWVLAVAGVVAVTAAAIGVAAPDSDFGPHR